MPPSSWTIRLLAASTLGFWHVPFVSGTSHFDWSIRNYKRSLDSWVSVSYNGIWPCSLPKIEVIENAVEYTKILANGAIVALDDTGTSSSAYSRWFSSKSYQDTRFYYYATIYSNAYESDLEAIKEHHYDAVVSELRAPESGTVNYVEEGGPDSERLVYACPAADDDICGSGEAAAVINAGDQGFKVNLLYLCPSFFNKVSHSRMLFN
ncbi:uncharacterized protein CLUP02_16970 [Colletotrichum lupini]|uniref:Uncharacterized protein n=1 Tax=Colletotrichum lupini TaxID=145971 RepID=A0A9Q8T9L8_9PEZI|nr:uncharacterized protein CLUP02_16970 [Colletotrichum lupini]UQC91435.1 hypothetical protein CLUP02_16970 [Colletotrichum lupini]